MKPINLYTFTRVNQFDANVQTKFAKMLSDCNDIKERDYEFQTIASLVDSLIHYVSIADFEGFYYSYSIPQLGEEFDLLKLSDNKVLSIELKSRAVGEEKILKQLLNKRHYLSHLPGDHFYYTYIKGKDLLYMLTSDGTLARCSIGLLATSLKGFSGFYTGNLDDKFRVSQFLVSPLNSPEKFLHGNYFLTPQQENISKELISKITDVDGMSPLYFSIHGEPGTGKTLLLYHLAKMMCSAKKVCIVHCAPSTEQLIKLSQLWSDVYITVPKNLNYMDLSHYDVFVVDETQRIYDEQLNKIINHVRDNNKICILGIDPNQIMSSKEKRRNIDAILSQIPYIRDYKLSKKIRTNPELAEFIEVLLKLNRAKPGAQFPNACLLYANSYEEGRKIIDYYESIGYTYISYTTSIHKSDNIDFMSSATNTHKVIGQEYDNVLIMLDNHFVYDIDGNLCAQRHPNPDYLFNKLFYQGITRVREKLMILVINNPNLFSRIVSTFTQVNKPAASEALPVQ